MRITGLATGLDMDALVKETMQPYRIKIQVQQQKKEVLEIKQKLYRDVINDCRGFYNKYFDISKQDSILLSKNWNTVGFSSSSDAVTVTAANGAKPGNYTITGTTATAAKAVIETKDMGKTVVVNGKEFTVEGTTGKEKAENLNKQLKESGMNVSVRYSDMAGNAQGSSNNKSGFIFESTVLGTDGTFTLGGTAKVVGKGTDGTNSTPAVLSGFTLDEIKGLKDSATGTVKLTIDSEEISFDIKDEMSDDDIINALNSKISSKGISAKLEGGDITFSTSAKGNEAKMPTILIGTNSGSLKDGVDGTAASSEISLTSVANEKVSINGKIIDLSNLPTGTDLEKQEYLNKVLNEQNAEITAKVEGDKVTFTANKIGEGSVDVKSITGSSSVTAGTDANIVIKDQNGGVYTHSGSSNTVTIDGITFNFNGRIESGETIKVTGKNDVTAVKDKLVNFINDYNTVMVKLNTLLTEKRDSSYMPLTDEQKESMSESEVKLWNSKVEKGQLKRDSDLTRIANGMKNAMRSIMGGNNLEKFGIEPVSDYQGTSNGTFTINEEKLVASLENNPEELMNLFITTNEDKSKSGIAQQLKSILYDETVTTSSALIKKAGIEGSASVSNNELTNKINKYTQKMEELEKDFTRREQVLYSKWATIETMMNSLNSQQSYLTSMLG